MKGARNFFTLLIFSIAVAFTDCSSPIGSLQIDSDSDATLNFIRLEPNRFVYSDEYDPFKPVFDVEVFGIFGGKEDQIFIEDKELKIEITEYPYGNNVIVLSDSEKENGLQLDPGRKVITISYRGKDAFYRISVGETKTGGDGDGSGSGSGITWVWP